MISPTLQDIPYSRVFWRTYIFAIAKGANFAKLLIFSRLGKNQTTPTWPVGVLREKGVAPKMSIFREKTRLGNNMVIPSKLDLQAHGESIRRRNRNVQYFH